MGASPVSGLGIPTTPARGALGELRGAVRRCQEAGVIDPGHDVEAVVRQMQVTAHGLADFENLGVLGDDPDGFWRDTVCALVTGLSNGRAPAPVVRSA